MSITNAKDYKKAQIKLRLELQDRVEKLERALVTIANYAEAMEFTELEAGRLAEIIKNAAKDLK